MAPPQRCLLAVCQERGLAVKRRILLVDDEVAILLTLKAVLEISGFDVETAASAREAKNKLRSREYHMIITDMRMENEAAGTDVIQAARSAPYHPAVALLTAFPVDEESWDGVGPDKILVKATQTRVLLQQIEKLFTAHAAKLSKLAVQVAGNGSIAGSHTASKAAKNSGPAVKNGGPATRQEVPTASLANLAAASSGEETIELGRARKKVGGVPGKEASGKAATR